MICYKGFNPDLTCTLGKGTFQYEIEKTYRNDAAKCAGTGFHCVEEPIEVLRWYNGKSDRYCIVRASGDVNEDGCNRTACTEITILKEITLQQLAAAECRWIQLHPTRKCSSIVCHTSGSADAGGVVIVRGRDPRAKGKEGATLFLLTEKPGTPEIAEIVVLEIGGRYKPDTWYNARGRACKCEKRS